MSSKHKQLATFISGNIRNVVNVVVGLAMARFMVQQLGMDGYAVAGFALSAVSLVQILGNALSGATARFLTLSHARGEYDIGSIYMSNTLAAVAGGGCVIGLLMYSYIAFFSQVGSDMPPGFLEGILVATVLSAVAGVLATGNFVKERFIARDSINTIGRVGYGLICGSLLCFTRLGLWAIVIAMLWSALFRTVTFGWSCRRLLPNVKKRLHLVKIKYIGEVVTFVGWMLLAYCGGYLIKSGILIVVDASVEKYDLGRYTLVIRMSLLIQQALMCLSAITAPKIYKRIALEDYRGATGQVEKFLFLAMCLGGTCLVVVAFEGSALLRLLVGVDLPGMTALFTAATVSALVGTFNVPISVFLAGIGSRTVRNYAIATLVSGVSAMGAAYLILRSRPDALVWVAACPAIMIGLQNLVIVLIYRNLFVWSLGRALLGKLAVIMVLAGSAALIAAVARFQLDGDSVLKIGTRLVLMALPLGVFGAIMLRPSRSRHEVTLVDDKEQQYAGEVQDQTPGPDELCN